MTTPGGSRQSSLLGAARIRQLAAELDLRPTKTLGQNFVHDANTVRRIVSAAALRPDDHVLEIGPGLGSLTLGLLDEVSQVTAVEIDPRLAALLPRTIFEQAPAAVERLRVVCGDGLTIGAAEVGAPTALVANLPYNVSVPVLLHLLAELPSLRRVLVMVQAEVADRLAAGPGSRTYGIPSVKTAWYGSVRRAGSIGRSVFWPEPNVDSALVSIDRHPTPTVGDRATVFAIVDLAFAQRRKMLRSALAGWAGGSAAADVLLTRAGIDPTRRGETLDLAGYLAIAAVARDAAPGDAEVPTR